MTVLCLSKKTEITEITGISEDCESRLTICPDDYIKGILIKDYFPGDGEVLTITIRSEETAVNLMIALQKAIDLGWFKNRA